MAFYDDLAERVDRLQDAGAKQVLRDIVRVLRENDEVDRDAHYRAIRKREGRLGYGDRIQAVCPDCKRSHQKRVG